MIYELTDCQNSANKNSRKISGRILTWFFKKRGFSEKKGAFERTRTFTPLGAQPPQGCVSTNSTTSARDW